MKPGIVNPPAADRRVAIEAEDPSGVHRSLQGRRNGYCAPSGDDFDHRFCGRSARFDSFSNFSRAEYEVTPSAV